MNRRRFLLASVLALRNSSFIYPSCQKCFSRIILVSKRFNCPKCGFTGEAENTSYRYKLSLKVAESNKLFDITVFGSCLDTFFGLTATGLHRYIEDPNEIPETLDNDTVNNLLTKAVETCFIGQSFIFGVTNFESQGSDSSKFLQQCPALKRETEALVASQIVLPDPSVAGFTVIDYFHEILQASNLRKLHHGSQANSCVLALGYSNSDLSSIYGSDSSSCLFVESYGRNNFSGFWQPSLELTSIVSQLTDNDDFSASEQSKALGALHQNRKCISTAEVTASSSYHEPIQSSWSLVSYMDKKNETEKLSDKLCLQANQLSAVCDNHHEIKVTDSNLFPLKMQVSLEPSNTKSFRSKVEIKNRYSQANLTCGSHNDADTPAGLQERSACGSPSSLRLEDIAGGSQDCDPEMWDDLPFSESLNKFLAAIESEIAITQTDDGSRKYYLDNDIDKLHAGHSRLSVTPQEITGALHILPTVWRSLPAKVKANFSKDNFLPKCQTNSSPGAQMESQPDHIPETVFISANGREMSDYVLPNAYHSAPFPSSKDFETIITLKKTTRIQPHGAKISLRPNTSECHHSFLNIKYTSEEKSLSKMSEKLTTLCSKKCNDVADLCSLENKQYGWLEDQDDNLTVCRRLTYPLEPFCRSPNISTNTLKEMPCGPINSNVTQSYSPGYEGSYNASADLFDVSAEEADIATEITCKSQNILLQGEKSLAESHPVDSGFSLRSRSENSSQSSQKLALQSISASILPKICSSPPRFQSDSAYDFEEFVPFSQSTPVARFHQTRIHGIKGTFEKLPAFYSYLDVNYKKTRISSQINTQQGTPDGPQNKKIHIQRSKSPIISAVTQQGTLNHSPIAECLETDSDEWVPPTTKKEFLSDNLQFQTTSLRKCLAACNSLDQEEILRKKPKHVKHRTDKYLIKKELNVKNKFTRKTPQHNYKCSGWISRESVTGLSTCSKVKSCPLFSESWPSSATESNSAWSPELFS
ncbi:DNA damage-induced apoptosis suppressor protein [Orycteropus afer afer]|uniref:DNA damage-induced apoptosis suppressor protein n=1 Tax=Orycteropus afer afer TaxID=1230840 RepID=A0A8B7A928_ORYAF|nr:DNA damage-induced apoptosis suppressor protein [Orycteropus afer afer]